MSPLYVPPTPVYRPPSASGGAGLTAGSITREHIADPAGVPSARLAARFEDDDTTAYVTCPATAGTTEFTVSLSVALHVDPSDARALTWSGGTGKWALLVQADRSLRLLENTGNTICTSAAGVLPADGSPHRVSYHVTDADAAQITLDGVEVASASHAKTISTQGPTTRIGTSGTTYENAGCTVWDYTYTDHDDSTKSVIYPLDGDLLNYAPGSTVADATATGWVSWSHINTAATGTYGATFVDGDAANYLVSPASPDTTEFTISFYYVLWAYPSVSPLIISSSGTGKWSLLIHLDGTLVARHSDGTNVASSAAGAMPADGLPHFVSMHIIDATSASVSVDGVEVASSGHAYTISGSRVSKIGDRAPGAVYGLTYTDHDNAANNLAYSLNNTLAETNGGTALTETGTVPFEVVIGSPPPKPVPAVRPSVTENTGASQTLNGTAANWFLLGTATQDDFGRLTSHYVNVEDGSLVKMTWSCTATLTTLHGSGTGSIGCHFQDAISNQYGLRHTIVLGASGDVAEIAFTRVFRVEDGALRCGVRYTVDADDTWDIANQSFTVIEYPNTP